MVHVWEYQAYLKKPGEAPVLLPGFPGIFGNYGAAGINDNGQIVGCVAVNFGPQYISWLLNPGQALEDLGTLPGGNSSQAWAINNNGQIAGMSKGSGFNGYHAYLKNPGQPMEDLGTLGGEESYVVNHCISANGQVVGQSQTASGDWHAFLKNPGETMQDLNTLTVNLPSGVTLNRAIAINDNGWIVGYTSGNYQHAFLLTPAAINVSIDIKPGSDVNSINPDSQGKITVAILSAPDFNAPEKVDWGSLKFGETGNEVSLAFCTVEDVNADGLPDLVAHFYTQLTAFQSIDTQGNLKGQTVDGIPLSGSDLVRLVPGK